jgi:hypothetical protein
MNLYQGIASMFPYLRGEARRGGLSFDLEWGYSSGGQMQMPSGERRPFVRVVSALERFLEKKTGPCLNEVVKILGQS